MDYRLSVENEIYPVEDIHFPTESALAREPVGKPFSFISPVRLLSGQRCVLLGDSGDYQVLVNNCLGFTCSHKYYVSGIIATKEAAAVGADY